MLVVQVTVSLEQYLINCMENLAIIWTFVVLHNLLYPRVHHRSTLISFFPKVQNNTLLFTKGVVYRLSHDCHLAIDRDAAHYPRTTISFTTLLLLLFLPACLPFLHPVRRLRLHRYTSFRNDLRFFQSRFLFLLKMKQSVKKSQVYKATK